MRKAFTLVELMVSIMILSLLMLFLYKSYADINRVNNTYADAVKTLQANEKLKKALYLDFLLASKDHLILQNSDKRYDFISFVTKHSLYRRIRPYVTYMVKDKILYRLESRKQIISPLSIDRDTEFDIASLGKVKKFKIFQTREKKSGLYLIDIKFVKHSTILLKTKVLN